MSYEVRFQKAPNEQQNPASITKLANVLVVRDWIGDAALDDVPIVPGTTTTVIGDDLVDQSTNSHADLQDGDNLSWRDLIYGMLLPSGNDAAKCLARNVGYLIRASESSSGDYVTRFVAEMNIKAATLGASEANFTDSYGVDPGNLATAEDVSNIMLEFIQDPFLVTVAGTYQHEMTITGGNARQYMVTHTINPDGEVPFPEFICGKTGTTMYEGPDEPLSSGGCCTMLWESPSGVRRISTVLGSFPPESRYDSLRAMIDYELARLGEL